FLFMSRIVERVPSGNNPRWSHRGHHMGTEGNALFWGLGTNSKVVGDFILPISNVDALPSKKAGIDGPSARSEHGQGGTEGSQQDIAPRIMGMRESAPYLNDCQKCPRDRRPQTCEQ